MSLSLPSTQSFENFHRNHRIAILFEAQMGDRRSSLAASLQRVRAFFTVSTISSLYEVNHGDEQASSLIMACVGRSTLPDDLLDQHIRAVELALLSAHPRATERIRVLLVSPEAGILEREEHGNQTFSAELCTPLAEIVPDWRANPDGQTFSALALQASSQVIKRGADLSIPLTVDLQNGRPAIQTCLNRVGVTGIRQMVAVGDTDALHWQTVKFDLYADLPASRAGMHMSRFSEALAEMLAEDEQHVWPRIDFFAEHLAMRVLSKQKAMRAEVRIHTHYPLQKWTPISGLITQESYGLLAEAVATPNGVRRLIGVEVEGLVACPCAQEMVHAFSRLRLEEEGIDEQVIEQVLAITPLATHNQRGRAALMIGTDGDLEVADLIALTEQAMSSENYGLLKRPDELYIVNKAHAQPRFVEDVVREIIRGVVDHYSPFPDSSFLWVRQRNEETIHKYDVEAEIWGTFGEFREELGEGALLEQRTTKEAWLAGKGAWE